MTTATQNIDALIERVDNQGTAIRGLAEESSTQIRDLRVETSRAVSELSANLKTLDAKMDADRNVAAERSRPQYFALFGGMIAAVGLAVTIIQWQSGLRDKPIDDKLTSLTQSIADLARTTSTAFSEVKTSTVTSGEFRQVLDFEKQLNDLKATTADSRRAYIQADIDRIDHDYVPRTEEQVHWADELRRDQAIEDRVKDLTNRFDELSPAANTLRDLAARQLELDAKIGFLKQSLIPVGSVVAKPGAP